MAYHLPLDAHPELGNNKQLAVLLELDDVEVLQETGVIVEGSPVSSGCGTTGR